MSWKRGHIETHRYWEDGSRQGQPTCAKLAARRSRAAWRAHGEQGAHPAELWPRGRCGRREARKGRLWPDRERINAGLRIWATTVYELWNSTILLSYLTENFGNLFAFMASQFELVINNPLSSEGDIRDVGLIPGSARSPGGGHGNPLQYSCLENPMERGAWRATVHRATKTGKQLKRLCIL